MNIHKSAENVHHIVNNNLYCSYKYKNNKFCTQTRKSNVKSVFPFRTPVPSKEKRNK